ncbi:hypothetical protein RS84_02864 [Microbacterium hydrocarbonoxydans]|uniref:Uncharacterized protein n=1 Tax=Microbacterium hydrocarbonoxydans TaxID=273678 RepID=A0A0M2HP50_9MICO|nr:hypothetical protein [Microbacterium hydrocarbonoxydans]KJL46237.1 hypothetical protein RS84_02864 [Microbacterium hydrocarbonoxydans]
MTFNTSQTGGNANTRVDELLRFGMEMFNRADMYVSPSKLSKLVRPVLRDAGYERARAEIVAYFDRCAEREIASYERALLTSSIHNIAYVGEKKKAPEALAGYGSE